MEEMRERLYEGSMLIYTFHKLEPQLTAIRVLLYLISTLEDADR